MLRGRSALTTAVLAFTGAILIASVLHLRPWNSVDLLSLQGSLSSIKLGTAGTSHTTEQTNGDIGYVDDAVDEPKIESSNSAPTPYCKWIFDKYESSAYEEQWFKEVPQIQPSNETGPNVCKAMQAEHHVAAATAIIRRVVDLMSINATFQWETYDTMPTTLLQPADNYMSRMHYRRVCYNPQTNGFDKASGQGFQLIEPLFGMLRDPFDHWCAKETIKMDNYPNKERGQSKLHIMPQGFAPYAYTTSEGGIQPTDWRSHGLPPWHSSLRPIHSEQVGTTFTPPQNIHLDLGSSYFGGWTQMQHGDRPNPAASGKWFYDHYHARGQKFNRFVAVEVEILNDTLAYQQVPDDLVGIYTLMNIPLSMGADKLNAVELIKRIVKPEDFFVFKLDIDSAPIEEPIVQSLLADDPENGGASALIDELMFEHHVYFPPMNKVWDLKTPEGHGDLMTSYELFRGLRRKGIRAHSWP
jgi:hypothetical protein